MILNLLLIFCSCFCCSKTENGSTIRDVEIFKGTPAWDLARALDRKNIKEASQIVKKDRSIINYQDPKFGITLLIRSVLTENEKAVDFLLNNKAEVNIVAKIGGTALFYAVPYFWNDVYSNEDGKYVKKLLLAGADPNIPFCSPKLEGVSSPIECGTSPLMHATQRGMDKVRLLVEHGANINYKTELGHTAAIQALINNEVDVAHYLIVEKKARINEPYYYYIFGSDSIIDINHPHYPVSLLEDWLYEIGSPEHQQKMAIVEEFLKQGQDYWKIEKHPKTVERIKILYPDKWKYYLDNY